MTLQFDPHLVHDQFSLTHFLTPDYKRCVTQQNSLARSDTGVVIDSEPHPSHTCKASLLFAPLAVRVQAGCSAFPFYTPTLPLLRLYFKYKTVLIPKLKMFFFYILDRYNKM